MRRVGPKDWLGFLLAFLYSLPAWAYPFGNDQALHWYLGRRWLDGELPFVSGISSKPVGMFALHALSIALFGQERWAIRITESFSVLAFGCVVAWAARPSDRPRRDGELGLGAMVLAAIYYTYFDYWDSGHPELWEGSLGLAAIAAALGIARPFVRDASAGALGAAAIMFKYPGALPALVAAAACATRAVGERRRDLNPWLASPLALVIAAGRFLAGFLPVIGLCVLPFAIAGKLGPMWEILYNFILLYREHAPGLKAIPGWLRIEHGGSLLLLTALACTFAIAVARERRDRPAQVRFAWLIAAFVSSFGAVASQGRYFHYHWVVMGPFFAALCMYALLVIPLERVAIGWRSFASVGGVTAALFWIGPLFPNGKDHTYRSHTKLLIELKRGNITRDQFLAPLTGRRPLDPPVYTEHVAAQLRALMKPGDTLCTRGFLTPLYQLTGMRCTTRHVVEDIVDHGLPNWPREYKQTLERYPPTFIVTFMNRTRDINDLKKRGYKLAGEEGAFRIFSLRDTHYAPKPPPPAPTARRKPRPKPAPAAPPSPVAAPGPLPAVTPSPNPAAPGAKPSATQPASSQAASPGAAPARAASTSANTAAGGKPAGSAAPKPGTAPSAASGAPPAPKPRAAPPAAASEKPAATP